LTLSDISADLYNFDPVVHGCQMSVTNLAAAEIEIAVVTCRNAISTKNSSSVSDPVTDRVYILLLKEAIYSILRHKPKAVCSFTTAEKLLQIEIIMNIKLILELF
jgi:hypothetical protein